jgi:ORF6N domain
LARLYGVTTGNLNKAVKRNQARFPEDFMFELTPQEAKSLRFQSGSLKRGQHFKYLPHAFTEQGVAMLSSVLRSERAVQVNIAIMRTFVQLRRLMDSNADLARKIENLEKKYDEKFATVFAAIKQLIAPDAPAKPRIGFKR